MSSPAQILANRQNAERSTGPVTAQGKARVSQNATRLGLFSVANFVRPEEQKIFTEFETGYMAELSPTTPLEQTFTREIIQAAWRLRRCASLETAPPENMTDEELDRLQVSIDRARAAAQRTLHRSLKELRRLQAEHLEPAALLMKQVEERQRRLAAETAQTVRLPLFAIQEKNSAKQTQSQAAQSQTKPALIPRSAPCPCGSGEKYKRCCGKNAPPVLSTQAA
jgi:uncharacterized protein YecA (UPF0149 family)